MFDRNARTLFDQAATAYDETRPGYPPKLIDKLVELAALPEKARILEIGCGTGQITRPLAARGYDIVAIELGEQLARVARENLANYPRVQVIGQAFGNMESIRAAPFRPRGICAGVPLD
jgi:16S rRNA A1518/A1519 N6-dimethyltransferase RsmA/KsgA/DIM1 with predicted DNA glycosylase/AP lyase activity